MTRFSIAAAALLVIATASVASSTTLTKVGGFFAAPSGSSCDLADGSRLRLGREEIQSGVDQMWLEHRDSQEALVAPPLFLALGLIEYEALACGLDGAAVVSWYDYGDSSNDVLYRFIPSDHRSAGPLRTVAQSGPFGISPVFGVWSGGYTIALTMGRLDWRSDVWMQGFDGDSSAQYSASIVSSDRATWHGRPSVGTDREGHSLLMWEEGGEDYRALVAVAAAVDGETSGEPQVLLAGTPLDDGANRVDAGEIGAFTAYWYVPAAGGIIGQKLRIDELAQVTTTTSTTSTTLDLEEPGPDFGQERDWDAERGLPTIGVSAASDGNGSWLASWQGLASNWDRWPFAHFAISNNAARGWSEPASVEMEIPAVVSDGAGEWLAVGLGRGPDLDGEGWVFQIQISRSTNNAGQWSQPLGIAAVPQPTDDDCYSWASAMTIGRSNSGVLAVVWTQYTEWCSDEDDRASSGSYVIRSTDNGLTWTLPQRIAPGLRDAGQPRLTSVGPNGWLLVLDGSPALLLRSVDDGLTWTSQAFDHETDIVCDSAGRCVSTFSEYGPSDRPASYYWEGELDIFARTSSDGGQTWSEQVPVNLDGLIDITEDRAPAVATDHNGVWTVAWVSHRDFGGRIGPDADLLYASSTDYGQTWSAPRILNASAATDGWQRDDEPELVYDAGVWLALWSSTIDAENREDARSQPHLSAAYTGCGDGTIEEFEQCDDGNRLDSDGCDSNCYVTGCGNGAVSAGEECDDGNDRDDDSCSSACKSARCGDGYVRARVEQCDDGNTDPTDACTADCTIARCGDGVIAHDVEQCDDGNTVDEDACPPSCLLASCGDGYIREGVEECDDANRFSGDRCTGECLYARCGDGYVWSGVETCDPAAPDAGDCSARCGAPACGDANADGQYTVSDSMTILSSAVGRNVHCPMNSCDVDGNLRIGAIDSLIALGLSVGLPFPLHCDTGSWLIVRLQDPRTIGAVQARVDVSGAPLTVLTRGGSAICEPFVAGMLLVGGVSGSYLTVGAIAHGGLSGPLDIGRCRVEMHGEVHSSQFSISIEDGTDVHGNQLQPQPKVVLRAAAY